MTREMETARKEDARWAIEFYERQVERDAVAGFGVWPNNVSDHIIAALIALAIMAIFILVIT